MNNEQKQETYTAEIEVFCMDTNTCNHYLDSYIIEDLPTKDAQKAIDSIPEPKPLKCPKCNDDIDFLVYFLEENEGGEVWCY